MNVLLNRDWYDWNCCCRVFQQGGMALEGQLFQMRGLSKHQWGVLHHHIQLLLALFECHIQIMVHPVQVNLSSWSLSQPPAFQRSEAWCMLRLCFLEYFALFTLCPLVGFFLAMKYLRTSSMTYDLLMPHS